jgi:double-strand break repair protein MRE11
MKDVRGKTVEGEVDEDSLQDMVWQTSLLAKIILTTIVARASERATRKGLRGEGPSQSGEEKGKVRPLKRNRRLNCPKGKAKNKSDEGESDDSMMMDIDAGGVTSNFQVSESDEPAPKTTGRGKKAAAKTATKAPAKKAPARGRGKKVAEVYDAI